VSEKAKVLVREKIADGGIEMLKERFDVDVDLEGDLAEKIGAYDAIIIRSATKLTADLIEKGTRLRVIGRAGVGVDNVDVEAATRRGIIVANAPDANTVSTAEHTIALLMALVRNIPQAYAALKQGEWERSKWKGIELAGKTLGIIGLGKIGQQVAHKAAGLGMHVIAYDPVVSKERFRELGVERMDSLDELYAKAEFLTLHAPRTAETTGMLNKEAFAKMRDGVRIINAARGALIVDDDLIEAIKSGKVAGAAIDVYTKEPYTGPLTEYPEIVVTPHLAASTGEAQDRAGIDVAEQVAAALEGDLVTNAVNIPSLREEDLDILGPYMPLAVKLGRLAMELAGGRADKIEVSYYGAMSSYDTRLLTLAVLNGAFEQREERPVNWVNARVVAKDRGIEVSEESKPNSRDFTNLLRVRVFGDGSEVAVSGTTVGKENRLWLAGALGYELEIELAPLMVFVRYEDVPGQIGRIGAIFGEAGVNIANMAVSRTRQGGTALMAFSIDAPAQPALIESFEKAGYTDARFIDLG
jgi:D-3-phosphoglycerate dehydrogenase / 2-oxoglutarate reductase